MTEPAQTGPVELSRLLDEIRSDPEWREQVEAFPSGAGRDDGAAAEALRAPLADPALRSLLDALDAGVGLAAGPLPVESDRALLGEAIAVVRRKLHAELAVYQERQAHVNRRLLEALRRLNAHLDPGEPGGASAELWAALGRLDARMAALERAVGVSPGDVGPLEELGASVEALSHEVEPLGRVRLAVDALEERLGRLEREHTA